MTSSNTMKYAVIIIAAITLIGSIYMLAVSNFNFAENGGYLGSGLVSIIVIISIFNTIHENQKHEKE